jgi:hypothetical protein
MRVIKFAGWAPEPTTPNRRLPSYVTSWASAWNWTVRVWMLKHRRDQGIVAGAWPEH